MSCFYWPFLCSCLLLFYLHDALLNIPFSFIVKHVELQSFCERCYTNKVSSLLSLFIHFMYSRSSSVLFTGDGRFSYSVFHHFSRHCTWWQSSVSHIRLCPPCVNKPCPCKSSQPSIQIQPLHTGTGSGTSWDLCTNMKECHFFSLFDIVNMNILGFLYMYI